MEFICCLNTIPLVPSTLDRLAAVDDAGDERWLLIERSRKGRHFANRKMFAAAVHTRSQGHLVSSHWSWRSRPRADASAAAAAIAGPPSSAAIFGKHKQSVFRTLDINKTTI